MRLFAMSPGLIWEQIKAGIRVRSILTAGKQVPAGHSEGSYSPEQALHKAERKENVGRTQKPAGINHHDEFVPQGGVTYRQVDLSKGALMFSDGPETIILLQFYSRLFPFPGGGRDTDRQTHSGYRAPSETSKRDEAMEFSDSRLWESNLRMFDVEAVEWVSMACMEPR